MNVWVLDNLFFWLYDKGDFIVGVGYLLLIKRCNFRGLNIRFNILISVRIEFFFLYVLFFILWV